MDLLTAVGVFILVYIFASQLDRIEKRIKHMADLEAQAIADLNAAAAAVIAMMKKLAADLAAAQAAAGTPPVDHSADIEAVVKQLTDAMAPAPAAS